MKNFYLTLLLWAVVPFANGETPDIDPVFELEFRKIAKDLRCPTCTGLSVLESEATFSVQIKDKVKEQMKQGKTKEQILLYFTERYGPWILREPPKTGFNMIAWILPALILLSGPPLIWAFFWRRKTDVARIPIRSYAEIQTEFAEQLEQQGRVK